ncbi:double zinc ribbon domain-containing protein [Leptolyngbya sp. NIES-2104]|uniref:double zinc ribbon domain-containing protein n=1 Tax=Leptolyngbya sp. NIES-2104 TaxID=1552121 RepID=UPI00073E2C74|nr:zinc ribbon domain-containing protein [Leptolyngbya sp. NIES-2104]
MAALNSELAPNPQESLADYVRRVRISLSLSQKDLAERAGIHLQSVGKIERGQTTRLKHKAKKGLAHALGISIEYLDAVCKGVTIDVIETLKFCPQCWTPGSLPDPIWTSVRAKYCYVCGTQLCDRCLNCSERILSPKFKFCPFCGKTYK